MTSQLTRRATAVAAMAGHKCSASSILLPRGSSANSLSLSSLSLTKSSSASASSLCSSSSSYSFPHGGTALRWYHCSMSMSIQSHSTHFHSPFNDIHSPSSSHRHHQATIGRRVCPVTMPGLRTVHSSLPLLPSLVSDSQLRDFDEKGYFLLPRSLPSDHLHLLQTLIINVDDFYEKFKSKRKPERESAAARLASSAATQFAASSSASTSSASSSSYSSNSSSSSAFLLSESQLLDLLTHTCEDAIGSRTLYFDLEQLFPALYRVIFSDHMAAIVKSVLGPNVLYLHSEFILKEGLSKVKQQEKEKDKHNNTPQSSAVELFSLVAEAANAKWHQDSAMSKWNHGPHAQHSKATNTHASGGSLIGGSASASIQTASGSVASKSFVPPSSPSTSPPHTPFLSLWIALDDMSLSNGTLFLLPYHRHPPSSEGVWHAKPRPSAQQPRACFAHYPLGGSTSAYDMALYDSLTPPSADQGEPIIAPAGSVAAFSSLALHLSANNLTNRVRRALKLQFAPFNPNDTLTTSAAAHNSVNSNSTANGNGIGGSSSVGVLEKDKDKEKTLSVVDGSVDDREAEESRQWLHPVQFFLKDGVVLSEAIKKRQK